MKTRTRTRIRIRIRIRILKETKILFLLGLVDLLATLFIYNLYPDPCIEANWLLRSVLPKDRFLFAFIKISNLVLLLGFVELCRIKSLVEDRSAKRLLRIGIFLYVFLAISLFLKVNFF